MSVKVFFSILFVLFSLNLFTQTNLTLDSNAKKKEKVLEEVVVSGKKTSDVAKQIFTVGDNLISSGGNATELLKSVPMVSVDMDGNPTIRNAAPQILVDGNPTTLTLDQIQSDLIDRIEIITNPSGKFDAEGQGGVINIILKKNKKLGFNTQINAGTFLATKIYSKKYSYSDLYHHNYGVISNYRNSKINSFINFAFNQKKINSIFSNERRYKNNMRFVNGADILNQDGLTLFEHGFYNLTSGVDLYSFEKQTITIVGNVVLGKIKPNTDLTQFYTSSENLTNKNLNARLSEGIIKFGNYSITINHKLEIKTKIQELNTSLFLNNRVVDGNTDYTSKYYKSLIDLNSDISYGLSSQNNTIKVRPYRLKVKTDYTNSMDEKKESKLEAGLSFDCGKITLYNNYSSVKNDNIKELLNSNKYDYSDYNLAAYTAYSKKIKKLNFQLSIRLERFGYAANLYLKEDSVSRFSYSLPITVFPSLFVTYNLNEKQLFEFSYSRRINRPSISNLTPYVDYTDSSNLKKGNSNLFPESVNIGEINFQHNTKDHYFLSSLYCRYTQNVITQYQLMDYSENSKGYLINSFFNSNYASTYGLELVSKNTLKHRFLLFEFNSNINFYNTILNGGEKFKDINRELFSYFLKETVTVKFGKSFSMQLFLDYKSKTLIPPSSGNRGLDNTQVGQRANNLTPTSTSQGYIMPNYGFDVAIKKDFLNGLFSVILNCSDILKTRTYYTSVYSDNFDQTLTLQRNQLSFYLNFRLIIAKSGGLEMKKNTKKPDSEHLNTEQFDF